MTKALRLAQGSPPRDPRRRGRPRHPQRPGCGHAAATRQLERDRPTYDVDDCRQRALLYEQVLAEGTAEDVRRLIDVDALIEVWDELELPRAVSTAWIDWIAEHRGVRLHDWRERTQRRAGM